MKFVIRDDDLNYFSTPSDIERWYADIFSQDIPVGFSTIPFVKPSSDVHPFYPTETAPVVEDKEYPVGDNEELIAYVKKNPYVEILQHGTTHETKEGVFEYQRKVARTESVRGREELERAFSTPVTVFVPPHDWIGTNGIHSVEVAHMNIIRGRGAGLRNFILRPAYIFNFVRMLAYKAWYLCIGQVPAYPYVLNFGLHNEVCSYRLEDTDVFKGLEYVNKKDGIFVVVTHLHFFDEEKKELLMKVIKRGKELGAEFVRPSTLFP